MTAAINEINSELGFEDIDRSQMHLDSSIMIFDEDVTGSIEFRESDCRTIINEAVESLCKRHPDMFKSTSRCKIPHVNPDILRDDLFKSDIIRRQGINSSEELVDHLFKINRNLASRYTSRSPEFNKAGKLFRAALNKAIHHDFYLGMERSWIEQA